MQLYELKNVQKQFLKNLEIYVLIEKFLNDIELQSVAQLLLLIQLNEPNLEQFEK